MDEVRRLEAQLESAKRKVQSGCNHVWKPYSQDYSHNRECKICGLYTFNPDFSASGN